MEQITITLPEHAIRYLRDMCERERTALVEIQTTTFGSTLQLQAAFDSLDAIESVLPDE